MSVLELLRLLDRFLPKINFGQAVPRSEPSPDTSRSSTPQGERHQAADVVAAAALDNQGFAYLKRDLVRMLGILCHEKKAVQDRIREASGIEVVMNMCVIDDRNPCKSALSQLNFVCVWLFFFFHEFRVGVDTDSIPI